ncbi:hypothetical protein HNP84_004590 [Thermocatellispora tengchongensis]|uniref:DUF8094 domain-containing protein n=1 Tax=Thermocatellispora tengchongensis TaxID=1073253 RepID=A0A840P8B8_9ACTN|nr:hypothetical protein [Thermocatellispora tengchongensis]MBB5134856.1 hypothetical protein [Thermocatellispora tengchongensis]
MRACGRRRAFLPAVITVVAAVLAGLTGCTGSSGPPGRGSPTPVAATTAQSASPSPSPGPALTQEEAREAVERYLATDDVLRAGGDLRMALSLARDGQAALTIAAYRSTGLRPARYAWQVEDVYVPRLERAPYWFTAVVRRTGREAEGGSGAAGKAVRGSESRTALLTLMKQDDEARWQLSFGSLLLDGADPPEVALDADGYATALPSRDETIGVSPQLMPPLHATVAEEGSKGFSAGLIEPGPYTTGYSDEIAEEKQQARHDGLDYDSIFSATQSPIFALRTEDGGALVSYEMTRTTTLTARLPSAPWIEVPENARWAANDQAVSNELRIIETHQYASLVPPRDKHEPAEVIAYEGAVTRVTGR